MQKTFRTAACLLAGTMLISGSAMTANAVQTDSLVPELQHSAFSKVVHHKVTAGSQITKEQAAEVKKIVKVEEQLGTEIEHTAVAQVEDYVNIRKGADENSEAVGKLYNKAVATITGQKGDWYQISSGSVKGYVKKEFVKVGDADLIASVASNVAIVNTTTLKVRKEASKDAEVLELVAEGDKLKASGKAKDGWVKVRVNGENGYVSADYVELSSTFQKAVSKEEEQKKAEKKQQSRGSAVVSYASQFVGNPYVWGGTSLTNGADCSGFVMSVYAHFGVSLPHSSSALRGVGKSVSRSEIKPGDIVCYSGHVGIYAGNNTLVHASNRKDGIKYTSNIDYRKIVAIRRIFS